MELGLDVHLGSLVATVAFEGSVQHYFKAATIGGDFGAGGGEEFQSSAASDEGSYRPVWVEWNRLTDHDVRPRALEAEIYSGNSFSTGSVLHIRE